MAFHRKLRMLWIEDQKEDFILGLDVLKDELFDRGFDLTDGKHLEAKTVEEAECLLEKCELSECKPDVILLDLMLPQDEEDFNNRKVDLDGGYLIWFEIRKMQKWQALVEIPILFITARGRPEYWDQVVADPATRWLSKPADPSKVAESITDLLLTPITAKPSSLEQPQTSADEENLDP